MPFQGFVLMAEPCEADGGASIGRSASDVSSAFNM